MSVARWLVILVGAVLGAALTGRLGLWQLERAQQKKAIAAQIAQRATQPALDARSLATTPDAAAAQHYRNVVARGRWQPERTVFLDNRTMAGRAGFIVVTPLQLADGRAVLVQRGLAPRDARERTRLPALDTPAGDVDVHGRIAPPPSKLFEFEATDRQGGSIRQNLDLGAFAGEIGAPLAPLSIQETDADSGLLQDWTLPVVDVSTHYGYAFQWFAMCALITGLYVWFQLVPRLRR